MSHDIEAAWAATEIANLAKREAQLFFEDPPAPDTISSFAVRDVRSTWPVADGVVAVETRDSAFRVAVEFKRENEGTHGILTALGQAQAYLHKEFAAAVIVLPLRYETLANPGPYATAVLEHAGVAHSVGVFGYGEPDVARTSPFEGRFICHRPIRLDQAQVGERRAGAGTRPETQWAHLREGSSYPDGFFRYLQTAKQLPSENPPESNPELPAELTGAVHRLAPDTSPAKYLSNSTSDTFHDKVWRHFWFRWVLTPGVAQLFRRQEEQLLVNDVPTGLRQIDGSEVRFFSGRADSIKNRTVQSLGAGEINEDAAWDLFAQNVRGRAHSFREDVDSGLEHIGYLEADGKPTEAGYRFVDASERNNDPNVGTPIRLLTSAVIRGGQLGAFIHYVHRLSDGRFQQEPLAFTAQRAGALVFERDAYLRWLEDELSENLRVMRKIAVRGGQARKPFQAEFAILRQLRLVDGFRIGVGLVINWPGMQEALDFRG